MRLRVCKGVDFEPDTYFQGITNVTFTNVSLLNNRGSGATMSLRQNTDKSPQASLKFHQCTIDGTGRGGFEIGSMAPNVGGGAAAPGILIENCVVRNTTTWGLNIFDKSASAAPILVVDSSFDDAGQNSSMVFPCPPQYSKRANCSKAVTLALAPLVMM